MVKLNSLDYWILMILWDAAAIAKKDWLVCLDLVISEVSGYTGLLEFGTEVS